MMCVCSFSDQDMGDTKVSIKGLHEDMRIFADEVSEESKTATERVKKIGNILFKVMCIIA